MVTQEGPDRWKFEMRFVKPSVHPEIHAVSERDLLGILKTEFFNHKKGRRNESAQRERIVAAAMRIRGKVYTGKFHAAAVWDAYSHDAFPEYTTTEDFKKAWETDQLPRDMEEGFVTNTGRFVDREEAFELAGVAGQTDPWSDEMRGRSSLDADDVVFENEDDAIWKDVESEIAGIERWVFTDWELNRESVVKRCRGDDEFYAMITASDDGIVVTRNGQVTNRWTDGTVGVPQEYQDEADEQSEYYKLFPRYVATVDQDPRKDQDEYAYHWRSVRIGPSGEFLAFDDPNQ